MQASLPHIDDSYWQQMEIETSDLDALSTHLLEVETPLSPRELLTHLIAQRTLRESEAASAQKGPQGEVYLPEKHYQVDQALVFPALEGKSGQVLAIREANTLNGPNFEVIEVQFEDGVTREFAAGLDSHALNTPMESKEVDQESQALHILAKHDSQLVEKLETALRENEDFVYIAGRWFPETLIVDVAPGQLNVAEALLDVAAGGPQSTQELLDYVELPKGINPKLATFSLDLALQEDERFDEVGPSGEVGWFLHRLEPEDVLETPPFLRYQVIEHDRSALNEDMLDLERRLEDELSELDAEDEASVDQVEVRLIFPHWRAGTLPLTAKIARLFPTAYESPRVKFDFVDGESGEHFPGWVVRLERYVYGLRDWYAQRGLMPGSYLRARVGEDPGEIIVETDAHRSSREWVRTALLGSEGGVVYAMLKQTVETSFDERMMVFMPSEISALDKAWQRSPEKQPPLESIVLSTVGEQARLNPQNYVHASELYATVNVLRRCPPGPIFALLTNSPDFEHVGDLHYRLAGDAGDDNE